MQLMENNCGENDLSEQRNILENLMRKPLKVGDTWYLVDAAWFQRWKKYVKPEKSSDPIEQQESPGTIDNSALFQGDGGELKKHLIDGSDYELFPEEAWLHVVRWYGLAKNQKPIARKVVSYGSFVEQTKVEVYLLELMLCEHSNLDKALVGQFSKDDTIACLELEMRRLFNIGQSRSVRLWNRYTTNMYELMTRSTDTLSDVGLYQRQMVILEVQNTDGSWPRVAPGSSRYGALSGSSSGQALNGNNHTGSGHTGGMCGLANLGNTCFMNSVLQCLSNTPPLCFYFLNNQHLTELNMENPLGMRGEIAKAFGNLIHEMWSGKHQSTVPRAFKQQVSRFAPQFSGYQQHDSQEMLTFILDALNEDLNRVRNKPYIELKDAAGRPDAVVAKEAWLNYRKRNSSIITDLFFGLLKSTVVCPECVKVSVTFDPFCMLQLPLPIKRERSIEICLMPANSLSRPTVYRVNVPKFGCVSDVFVALEKLSQVSREHLLLADIYQNRLRSIYNGTDQLRSISEKERLFAFERPPLPDDFTYVPVYTRVGSTGAMDICPFFLSVRRGCSTEQDLVSAIMERMARYCTPVDSSLWTASSSQSSSNGQLDSDDDSEVGSAMEEEREPPFRVSLVDRSGSGSAVASSAQVLPPGGLQIPSDCALLAVWQPEAFGRCFDLAEERARHQHESVQQSRGGRLRPSIRLAECLELFTTTEQLGADDAWYCPDCKKHQQATKKFDVWSLPEILIIHFKRFSYSRILRDKIDAAVEFPVRGLDMQPHVINSQPCDTVYDLIGVSNHYGGLGGGHYVATCRNRETGNWCVFDDSNVSPSSAENVCTKAAYVLFYQRRRSTGSSNNTSSENLSCAMETDDAE